MYYIYPRKITEVNVSAIRECPRQWGKCLQHWGGGGCPQQWGKVRDSGGSVRDRGVIEHGLGNSGVDIVIYNSAQITSEDTWNNM